ncbi:MAG: hypothetical protein GF347_00100 [Candidatus Moranbacteria bacterium]|nr:hypothetical protein [Candidatus Moranbacteria bacterium]
MENLTGNDLIQFVIDQKVPVETVELILIFPIIATVIVIARQVMGIKAFGIYTPSLVALAFISTGLKYGIFLFLMILITGTATRLIVRRFRLLYLPRVAIMLTVVSITILLMLIIGGYFKMTGFASVSIFPILILITIMEKFISVQVEKGFKTAFYLSFLTLVLSIISYYIANFQALRDLMTSHPWLIFIVILFNILLGKWTGLRVSEYYRFREVIKRNN